MATTAYSRYVCFQVVIALSLVWAVIGSFTFDLLVQHFGLQSIGFELRVTLFLAYTVGIVAVLLAIVFGVYWLFKPENAKKAR